MKRELAELSHVSVMRVRKVGQGLEPVNGGWHVTAKVTGGDTWYLRWLHHPFFFSIKLLNLKFIYLVFFKAITKKLIDGVPRTSIIIRSLFILPWRWQDSANYLATLIVPASTQTCLRRRIRPVSFEYDRYLFPLNPFKLNRANWFDHRRVQVARYSAADRSHGDEFRPQLASRTNGMGSSVLPVRGAEGLSSLDSFPFQIELYMGRWKNQLFSFIIRHIVLSLYHSTHIITW